MTASDANTLMAVVPIIAAARVYGVAATAYGSSDFTVLETTNNVESPTALIAVVVAMVPAMLVFSFISVFLSVVSFSS